MQDIETPREERIQVVGDSGYRGLSKYFADTDERVPYKKPKNKELSKTKKAYNKAYSKRRIKVGTVFAHVKNWSRISGRYDGMTQAFNDYFNAICGMYNMRKMHRAGTYRTWKDKILRMESYKET
ncbi:MAG: transposase family protein [Cenarchaeum sp. SB0669_bin_11]|nr:transposase family protein [Cenarchaeum sp. SB0675_bin_21]MYL10580.1 transposase family protein [Cenarchaeum sp. SB0669_bin_11]